MSAENNSLPRGWVLPTLGEIVQPTRPRHSPRDFADLPFIGMENIEAHTLKLLGTVLAGTMRSSAVHFQPSDVLYGRLRPYLNKVFCPDFEGLCSAEFIVFPQSEHHNSKFIQYLLNSADFVSFASLLNAGDRPRVDFDQIAQYRVPVPPLPEQRRIVAEIEKQFTRLEAAVAALKRVQANLKRYRAAVLKAAVEGHLVPTEASLARAEGRSYEPASELLKRILAERRARWEANQLAKFRAAGKERKAEKWKSNYEEPYEPKTSSASKLPGGWSWATISQLGFVQSGQTPKGIEQAVQPEGEIPWFKVGDMNRLGNEKHMISAAAYISSTDATQLGLHIHPPGTIIFPKRGGAISTNKKRLLARLSGYDLNTMGIIPVTRNISGYLWWWFAGVDLGQLGDGSNVPQINHGDIEPLCLPIPPLAEQQRIVTEVERRHSFIDELEMQVEANLKRAERLRQAILKRAFEGRLVPQDPDDEPASVLLERIRAERAAKPVNAKPARRARKAVAT